MTGAHESPRRARLGPWGLILAMCCLLVAAPRTWAQQVFTQVARPGGIAVDLQGNVFVIWDAVLTTKLTKFAPNGAPVAEINLGGITVGEFTSSHLALDPGTGNILLLTPQGVLYAIRPDTLEGTVLTDLRTLPPVDDSVFDVLVGGSRPLVLGTPRYLDLAVRRLDNARFDVFVSASTGAAGGFPFVMRVRFNAQVPPVADVIVTSSGTTVGDVAGRPGVAVNAQGLVITTMPFQVSVGFVNGLVAFGADFPENPASVPRFALLRPDGSPIDFTSTGMTSDPAGNFYVTTGVVGISACGVGGSGALVFLPAALNNVLCVPSGLVLASTEDVAVSPAGDSVYMTDFGGNAVLRFPPAVPTPGPAALSRADVTRPGAASPPAP
ncbi:hypothetical protein P2318_28430 [Myxococcaceae bacterium GXIMD 01537]